MQSVRRHYYLWSSTLLFVLFVACLFCGSVWIAPTDVVAALLNRTNLSPTIQFIVVESRFPQAVTALLAGGSLAVSGLLLQTAFRNPLAAPDIFGATSGAGLMVALVTLGTAMWPVPDAIRDVTTVMAAFIGAMAVTMVIWMCGKWVKQSMTLIIIGVMVGYLASSAITVLNYFATADGVKNYALWGMGDYGAVSLHSLPMFSVLCGLSVFATLLLMKPLNAMLLGREYAENLGVNYRQTRNLLLVITGFIAAVVTAYCGPVSFIALAVPHLSRLLLGTTDHRRLLPFTIVMGGAVSLFCNLLTTLPFSGGSLPLNGITPLIGAPVILYVLMKR